MFESRHLTTFEAFTEKNLKTDRLWYQILHIRYQNRLRSQKFSIWKKVIFHFKSYFPFEKVTFDSRLCQFLFPLTTFSVEVCQKWNPKPKLGPASFLSSSQVFPEISRSFKLLSNIRFCNPNVFPSFSSQIFNGFIRQTFIIFKENPTAETLISESIRKPTFPWNDLVAKLSTPLPLKIKLTSFRPSGNCFNEKNHQISTSFEGSIFIWSCVQILFPFLRAS